MSGKVHLPAKYQAVRQALAECVRVDEVKTMRDKAIAMEVYAQQQKDADLIAASVYIRKRSERRIGELLKEEREAGKLAKGTRGQKLPAGPGRGKKGKTGGSLTVPPVSDAKTLAARGIDKHLADRARKAAAMSDAKWQRSKSAMRRSNGGSDDRRARSSAGGSVCHPMISGTA